jgi:hypothetical protein
MKIARIPHFNNIESRITIHLHRMKNDVSNAQDKRQIIDNIDKSGSSQTIRGRRDRESSSIRVDSR